MAKGYILIEVSIGRTAEVASALRKIPGVISVDVVTGPYDVIAVVEKENLSAIGQLVLNQIHTIPGVTRTMSCLAVKLS